MKAVGYVRVSTEGQVGDDKFGIDSQKTQIKKYAEENGYEIIKWYVDEGISGTVEERPALNEMIYGVENPPIEAVIVAKSDRLARDMKLYFYFLFMLEKKNIKLLSVTESFDNDNGLSNIYRSLMLFVAEQERKNIAYRTSKGRNIKARAGGYSGGRNPFGYTSTNGVLKIKEDEAETVRKIFEMTKSGTNMLKIAEYLNDNGIKSRTGGKFYTSTIKAILENKKMYQGMYKYGGSDWVNGVHDPILKEEI